MAREHARGMCFACGFLALVALMAPSRASTLSSTEQAPQKGKVFTNDDMPASADDAGVRSYPLPDHGVMQFQIPDSWKDDVGQSANKQPPLTVVFSQGSGDPFQMMINVEWPQAQDQPPVSDEELRKRAQSALDSIRDQAVEKTIEIQALTGNSGSGYYFAATDRRPATAPGDFKYVTQGIYQVDNLLMAFTVLTNDGQQNIAKAGLAAISSATHRTE